MSFEEKSTWAGLLTVALVYGWYFAKVSAALPSLDVTSIEYQGLMIKTVVVLIAISIATHIAIAIMAPDESDQSDERDRAVNVRGEYIGGYIVSMVALLGLGMAMYEMAHFWIANTLLLGLVMAELVGGCAKLYLYRRGF